MLHRDKVDPEMRRLSREQKAAVKSFNDDPRYLDLQKQRAEVQNEKREIDNRLNGGDYRYDPAKQEAAVRQLVEAGILAPGTTQLASDIIRQSLVDRHEALAQAEAQIEHQIRQTELEVITENCELADSVARAMNLDIIKNAEALRESILAVMEFYWLLSHKGNREILRPDKLKLQPWEAAVVYGGNCPTVEFYLENKKKFWGIK